MGHWEKGRWTLSWLPCILHTVFRQTANSSSCSLHCAQNGAVLWESGEGGHGHRLGSLWCGGHVAAGKEAIDEEEARLERSVWAAWQPAAPRHQRFLQKLTEGEGDEEKRVGWQWRHPEVLEQMELLPSPMLRLITEQNVTWGQGDGWEGRPAAEEISKNDDKSLQYYRSI